ncbi:MAG: glycosyltransferase [Caldilineales bacterium]|nr:glycosyltransferase [Caldilineales bacterium]
MSALGLDQHNHFLGFAPASLLPWLYNAATVFVYPSRYEGFGLPVAEALACGLPAITSTASSLPEVAGEAAHTVDPDDTETLAVALAAITGDAERRAMMRAAGLAQAERFRWTLTAAKTAALYASITEDRHG